MTDLIFVGGGLSSILAALRIKERKPECQISILEKNAHVAGNHTWSFHAKNAPDWLKAMATSMWQKHEVRFSKYSRVIESEYRSLRSHTLIDLAASIAHIETNIEVTSISENFVSLADGRILKAQCVIDSRGLNWRDCSDAGYQKFFGMALKFKEPHGIHHPILMDARCDQKEGFHFFYSLPYSENLLLVEDTYYSPNPELNEQESANRIMSYLGKSDSEAEHLYSERGVLVIPLSWRKRSASDAAIPEIGMRGGFFNFVTGYSILSAARVADTLANISDLTTVNALQALATLSKLERGQKNYELILNRMMFEAADDADRFRIFERFYTLPNDLIENLYAGKLDAWQRIRILSGRPPVSVRRAILSLMGKRSK